jgi:hypothetical protein
MMQKPEIVTFWHGNKLGRLRRLCLSSQVMRGHKVTVFAFDPIDDLPPGVIVEDAEPILSKAFVQKIRPGETMSRKTSAQFSDFFRMRLQRLGRGLWLDTDVYLLRSVHLDPSRPFIAWENLTHVGNSVLYLPPEHRIVADYEELMAKDVLFSNMLLPYHRLIGYWRRFRDGDAFIPADTRFGLYGPAALTWLVWRHGAIWDIGKSKSFYRVHQRAHLFFKPGDFQWIISDPAVIGLHVQTRHFSYDHAAPGSLYEWAEQNVQTGAS